MFDRICQYIMLAFAVLLLLVGVVTFLLPIPLGIVLLVIGVAVLLSVSPRARGGFHRLRARYPMIDNRLTQVEPHLPESLRKVLRPDSQV